MTNITDITIKPGYLVVDCSTAKGGVHYRRTPLDERAYGPNGEGVETDFKVRKIVDHKILVKDIDALIKRVDYALRKHAVKFGGGAWFADEGAWALIREDVAKLQAQLDDLNQSAAISGCARRGYINVVASKIDVANPDTAREIAKTIRETLGVLRDYLRAGDFRNVLNYLHYRGKNLPQLIVSLDNPVEAAVADAKAKAAQLREAIKAGTPAEQAGADLDLSLIESTIDYYSDPYKA